MPDYAVYKCNPTRKSGSGILRGWDWTRTAQLEARSVSVTRRLNGASEFSFETDRDADDVLTIGDYVSVARDGDDFVTGLVTNTGIAASSNRRTYRGVGAYTELTRVYFPPEYTLRGNLSSDDNRSRLTSHFVFRRITSTSPDANGEWDGRGVLTWGGLTGGSGSQIADLTNVQVGAIVTEGFTDGRGILSMSGGTTIDGVPQEPYMQTGTYESPYIDVRSGENEETNVDGVKAAFTDNGTLSYRLALSDDTDVSNRTFSGDRHALMPGVFSTAVSGTAEYVFVELRLQHASMTETTGLEIYAFDMVSRYAIKGVSAGTFANVGIDEMEVGGQSLSSVLQSAARLKRLEYWEEAGGEIRVGAIPGPGEESNGKADKSVEYSLSEGLHFELGSTTIDNRLLANVIRVIGPGEKNDAEVVEVSDAASIAAHGVKEKTINISSANEARLFTEMKQIADDALEVSKDARIEMSIDVRSTPHGELDVEPGDVIRITSTLEGLDGNLIEEKMRIIRDQRRYEDGAERTTLIVETAPRVQE